MAKDEKGVEGAMVGKETIEHTLVDVMLTLDEVPSVVIKFSGDSGAPQVDEVSGDISTIDEEMIGIKAS